MLERSEKTPIGLIARGSSARNAATWMHYGNIIALTLIPLILLWCGASMLVYALNRHHPNPKVGYYTQRGATRFYAITGFLVVVATFIPGGGWQYYVIAWALAALIIIPWSIVDLVRIYKDEWVDVPIDNHGVHE
jgi:hypothetical protein